MTVDEIQLAIMPERGTIYAVLNMKRMQEENHAKVKKLYMYHVKMKKNENV